MTHIKLAFAAGSLGVASLILADLKTRVTREIPVAPLSEALPTIAMATATPRAPLPIFILISDSLTSISTPHHVFGDEVCIVRQAFR